MHECYGTPPPLPFATADHPTNRHNPGILHGRLQVVLGVGTGDGASESSKHSGTAVGLRLALNAGDVVVYPAGTAAWERFG